MARGTATIGILEAGANRPELAQRHGSYVDFFETYFGRHDPSVTFKAYRVFEGEMPPSIDDSDAYVITGSRYSTYDDYAWIADLKSFVQRASEGRPVLGICFGHQLIAEAFGGEVVKSPKGWGVGVHNYDVYQSPAWMRPGRDEFSLLVSHQDQVVTPPPDATVLAGSEFCPIGMLAIGESVATLQSHPEMSKPFVADLFEARRAQIGADTVDAALRSLDESTHEDEMAMWLLGFLRGGVSVSQPSR
jgi:GMP synthase-like glutamine amidotransferase